MKKIELLEKIIGEYKSAIIAFSGGVDSTFLAYVSQKVLPDHILLVTITSAAFPAFACEEAQKIAASMKINHRIIGLEENNVPEFWANLPDRCYFCKKALFGKIRKVAVDEGYDGLLDGSNADDNKDYRPGIKALAELSIRSPLGEAGLTKAEIRELSRKMGLSTALKPSQTCLASRFPYGEAITRAKLKRVDQAESELRALGFIQFRIRSHGDLARVEFLPDEIETGWAKRNIIQAACKKAGFVYVAIDTEGYRMGSMNEALSNSSRQAKIHL